MKLIIVIHGETILQTQFKTEGWSDSPLTDCGIQYANGVKEKLKNAPITKAYSSSSERAIDTAEIILDTHPIELEITRELKDINYGTFEATPNYIREAYLKYGDTSKDNYKEAGGEDYNQFSSRINKYIQNIIVNSNENDVILIVTHQRVADTLTLDNEVESILINDHNWMMEEDV